MPHRNTNLNERTSCEAIYSSSRGPLKQLLHEWSSLSDSLDCDAFGRGELVSDNLFCANILIEYETGCTRAISRCWSAAKKVNSDSSRLLLRNKKNNFTQK